MKKNRTYRTNAFLAMMLAGSFLAGTTSLASESKAGSLSEAAASQQQNRTVTGKVIDASGQGAVGIGVMVKGTSNGTLTNPDGTFTLSNVAPGATIVFSSIGYRTVEVVYEGQPVNVTIAEDNELLDESVVTALGIKRERKSLGYAVEDINASELMKNKTANAISSLSGKIAGVNITQSSGAAGSGAQIILRGGTSGSENRDNQPLFVVDGIIYDNSSQVVGNSAFDGSGSGSTTTSNRVMDINPEDIESMSILKGPAASALYGSRAANGVVSSPQRKVRTVSLRSISTPSTSHLGQSLFLRRRLSTAVAIWRISMTKAGPTSGLNSTISPTTLGEREWRQAHRPMII